MNINFWHNQFGKDVSKANVYHMSDVFVYKDEEEILLEENRRKRKGNIIKSSKRDTLNPFNDFVVYSKVRTIPQKQVLRNVKPKKE